MWRNCSGSANPGTLIATLSACFPLCEVPQVSVPTDT
jgi:hypothetical protein